MLFASEESLLPLIFTGISAGFTACGTAIVWLWRDNRKRTKILEKRCEEVEEKERKCQTKTVWLESQIDQLSSQIENQFGPDSIQAVIGVDFGGIIREWSPSAVSMLGWRVREVLGKPITMLIPEKYRDEHSSAYEKAVNSGLPEYGPRDVFIMHRSGIEIPVTINLSAYRSGDKKIMRAVVRRRVEGGELSGVGKVHL